MSNIPLALSSFAAGPRDSLATADVYSRSSGAVINSIQKLASGANLDFATVLRGGQGLLNLLPMVTNVVNGNLVINKENLIARLAGSSLLGTAATALRNIGGNLVDAITENVPGASDVFASISGVTQKVLDTDMVNLSSVAKVISSVTGNAGYGIHDQGAAVGLFSGLLNESMRYGVPDSFSTLSSSIVSSGVLGKVISATLPNVIASSDVRNLRAMAQTVSSGQLTQQYPNLVQAFSSQYKAPTGYTAPQAKQTYEDVVAAFSEASPNWNQGSRVTSSGTSSTINVSSLTGASSDLISLIKSGVQQVNSSSGGNTNDKYYTLASLFNSTSVDQQLAKHFPMTVLGASQRSSSAIVDARALNDRAAFYDVEIR